MKQESEPQRARYDFHVVRSVHLSDQLPNISCERCEVRGHVWARSVDSVREYCRTMCRIPGLWLIEVSKGKRQLEPLQIRVELEIVAPF